MSLLDDVAAKVKSSIGQNAAASGVVDSVLQYLQGANSGGLQGLVKKLQASGLGQQVQSWIGTGTNLPVTPDQVTAALGNEEISRMAAKAGISPAQTSEQLSTVLPHVVDHLTPTGHLPADGGGAIDQLGSLLKGKRGG